MPRKITEIKRIRIERQVDTEELQAVLSRVTVSKIENGVPVSYKSAALYCRALGVDPQEYIIEKRKIAILEVPERAS
jgi:transcriptional regulator with XRE-family HTH domain